MFVVAYAESQLGLQRIKVLSQGNLDRYRLDSYRSSIHHWYIFENPNLKVTFLPT